MMNDDMLRNIEYLREKADVSYEEAETLLDRFDGNVMRVLVELERQGRIYDQAPPEQGRAHTTQKQREQQKSEAGEKAKKVINNAFRHHVVVESGKGEDKKTIANLSAPFVVGASIVAPHLAIASAALMFISGYRVKIKKVKQENIVPDDVETFVDKTVSNIKQTASSLTETVRGCEKPKHDDHHHDDGDDGNNNEGGEITVD